MTIKPLLFSILLFSSFFGYSQQIDTDKLYLQALKEYRQGNFDESLKLAERGINVAPEYHDIRILKVRNLFALQQLSPAKKEIDYLLTTVPQYEGVKGIASQYLDHLETTEALEYTNHLLEFYATDQDLRLKKARLLIELDRQDETYEVVMEVYKSGNLNDGQRYMMLQLINLTARNAVQVTGQFIHFSEDYPRNDAWYAVSAEYQHNFRNLAVIGRATYSDRSYNSGSLYEIDAYPIFSEKVYAFANLGISEGVIFPDYRASASVFYNFAASFEAEAGFRSLFYNDNSYFTAIAGLTAYTGRFYLNARAFAGPERLDQLVQNYQFNARYYLSSPENYLFGRIGSGISPDDPVSYTRAQENPTLEAIYFSAGINKTLGLHHVISLSAGISSEDLSQEKTGTQLTASLGYRYKF